MPERVEDLPESRRVELMVAAVEAGVEAYKGRMLWKNESGDGWAEFWHAKRGHDIIPLGKATQLDAFAAAALALGLEPKWRVLDKVVADEALPHLVRRQLSLAALLSECEGVDDALTRIHNAETKALDALARALAGEV